MLARTHTRTRACTHACTCTTVPRQPTRMRCAAACVSTRQPQPLFAYGSPASKMMPAASLAFGGEQHHDLACRRRRGGVGNAAQSCLHVELHRAAERRRGSKTGHRSVCVCVCGGGVLEELHLGHGQMQLPAARLPLPACLPARLSFCQPARPLACPAARPPPLHYPPTAQMPKSSP